MSTARLIVVNVAIAFVLFVASTTPAGAQAMRTAGAFLATAGGTLTGGVVFSGVTDDITTASNEDLRLAPAGTGSVVLHPGDSTIDILESGGTQRGSILVSSTNLNILATVAAIIGSSANRSATQVAVSLRDNTSGSVLDLYGGGAVKIAMEQTATCAAGVLTLDPQSSFITVDANAAACVVTLSETSAATIGPGFRTTIVLTNVSGNVTFPDSANVSDVSAACGTLTTTNSTLELIYANKTDDMWVGVSCAVN